MLQRDAKRRFRPARMAAALIAGAALAGCAADGSRVAPSLEPMVDAVLWPTPPEISRYAYVTTLIGEQNFLAPKSERGASFGSVLRWIAGIGAGQRQLKELQRPSAGLVDDQGRILVVDASRQSVMVFDIAARRLWEWREAAEHLGFSAPVAIAGDGHGGYLVTDSDIGEVFRLDAEGRPVARFGANILARPTGIAVDTASGNIYVADSARHDIKIFDSGGILIDTLGVHGPGPGEFNAPTYLAFANGELYVADTLNFRIQVFSRDGNGRLAFGRIGLFVGNMTRPKGVAVGGDGRIYVIESYYDHVLIFDRDGQLLLPIGGTGNGIGEFFLPSGIWTDAQKRVYIADMFNGRVVVMKELTSEQGATAP